VESEAVLRRENTLLCFLSATQRTGERKQPAATNAALTIMRTMEHYRPFAYLITGAELFKRPHLARNWRAMGRNVMNYSQQIWVSLARKSQSRLGLRSHGP